MSRRDYSAEIPEAEVAAMSDNERRWYREVQDLVRHARKRFWELQLDQDTGWYRVLDPVGRELCPAQPLTTLRGFFHGLPPQA